MNVRNSINVKSVNRIVTEGHEYDDVWVYGRVV